MTKFGAVFRYELSYRLRSPLTWLWFALIWGGTIFMVHVSSTENDRVVNAPARYAEMIAVLEFLLVAMTAWIFGDAATRDSETRTLPLFSTAPLSKFDYLGGRYAASFIVHVVLLLGIPLMVMLCRTFPWLSHFNWAPFQLMAFVQPFLLLTLPNLLVRSSVIYTIAALTKNGLATYLGAVGIAVLYLIVVNNGLGNESVEVMIDALALNVLQEVKRFWTPSEQVTRLIGFPTLMLWNRALWIVISAGLLVFLYRRFSFAHPGLRGLRRSVQAPGEEIEAVRHAVATVRDARREFRGRTRWVQLREVARHSFRDVARNRVFLVMIAGAAFFATMVGWEVGAIVFDTSTWPVTHLMAGSLNGMFVAGIMVAIISLITGELVWRERETGVADIAAVAPMPDWIPVLGRILALVGVLVLLQGLFTLVGLGIQAAQGYYRFELGLYAKMMFGTQLVTYVIMAALAVAVHVIVNQKALGHTVVIGAFIFTILAPIFLPPFRHNLLLFNGTPGLVYSDLNGFGPFLQPWLWFKAYWGAWALLLGVGATVFWVRSSEGGLRARARLARLRLAGNAGRAAATAGFLIIATGGFVFWNTNVRNDYVTDEESADRRVAYEQQFKRYEHTSQPSVVTNVLHVDIRPEETAVDIRGTYHLVNATPELVDTVLVSLSNEVRRRRIAFVTRDATPVASDDDLQVWIYALREPLAPGDTMVMEFQVEFERRGFPNRGVPTEVVANGAYFDRGWLPSFGYQTSRELADTTERRKRGLPARVAGWPSPSDTTEVGRRALADRGGDLVDMDVTIATAPDQVAVTPGRLVAEWENDGRKHFRYVTETPVSHGVPVFSGRFALRRDDWNGRPLTVYHHPTHDFNVDRMVDAMKTALDYNTANYGPYPYHELRVVEFPRYASFARAHPHTIAFGEGSAFITRIDEDAVDRTFMVVAHETAHQWWGNALRPARMKGGALVSETLAQFNAHMAIEKRYGMEMSRKLYGFEREQYFRGRAQFQSRESPLVEVYDQNHLYYFKGAIAMYTLKEMIGEGQVNLALRRFYEKFANRGAPYPTSLDLVSELRAVTPDSLQSLITDLFETITVWDVKTDSATATQVADSAWDVALHVRGYKARADSVGKETEVPMDDLVEIGVYGERTSNGRGAPLYLQRHRVRSGLQTITVRVNQKPADAGVDPDYKLIDRVRWGEVMGVLLR